jgi:hypothetical protein
MTPATGTLPRNLSGFAGHGNPPLLQITSNQCWMTGAFFLPGSALNVEA